MPSSFSLRPVPGIPPDRYTTLMVATSTSTALTAISRKKVKHPSGKKPDPAPPAQTGWPLPISHSLVAALASAAIFFEPPSMPQRSGVLLLVSGPSGSGKTTLCRQLARDGEAHYSISCTTRPARESEVHARDYSFSPAGSSRKTSPPGIFSSMLKSTAIYTAPSGRRFSATSSVVRMW